MQNVLVDDRRIWVDLYAFTLDGIHFFNHIFYDSSQSVARLNNSWSNNPKVGGRSRRGQKDSGFGGRDDLERTRRYRGADYDVPREEYRMVFDFPDDRQSRRRRSRSRERDRSRERRSRSPKRRDRRR